MATPNYHRVINASPAVDATFPKFQHLPAELRLTIWEHAVASQRLLYISIFDFTECMDNLDEVLNADGENPEDYAPTEACKKIVRSGGPYVVEIGSGELYSRLMHVNSEARGVALKFYSIHMPCIFTSMARGGGAKYGMLYLNPEYDMMRLSTDGYLDATIAFLDDARTRDPRGAGILKLALASYAMKKMEEWFQWTAAHMTASVNSLATTLAGLQEVVLVAESRHSRAIFGPLQSVNQFMSPSCVVRFNHAMPIMPNLGFMSFDLRPDPRPVKSDELRHVVTTSDCPRRMHQEWRLLLQRSKHHMGEGAKEESTPRVRVLFADSSFESWVMSQVGGGVKTLETAAQFLSAEESNWLDIQEELADVVVWLTGKEPPIESIDDLRHATRPAVGFWLFDAHVLGPWDPQAPPLVEFDMRDHWPELALVQLDK